jgi:hypothetical protein
LPGEDWKRSVDKAFEIWPGNRPDDYDEARLLEEGDKVAVDIFRYWGDQGVELTVGFIETPDAALRARILWHMNAWRPAANVSFVESNVDPHVRIARFTAAEADPGHDGYWSNLGTDILLVAPDMPTMNLEAFTMTTPDAEFHRVVRHEAGHTLGFPHEHMRKELVDRLDREKVIAWYMASQGWTEQVVIDQVLTPLCETSIRGTPHADDTSIMCYQIAAELTVDGVAIPGGLDINDNDRAFAALVYPRSDVWPVRPPPGDDHV